MPELPEVETMRRGILPALGSRIVDIQKPRCRVKPIEVMPPPAEFRRRTKGQSICAIERVGKRVVLRLDSDDTIVFEPRMTGLVLVADPPTLAHLRFRLDLAGGPISQILFWDRRGLGNVRLLSPRQFDQQLGPDRLGPDPLKIDADELRDRFKTSRREVKTALLDQRAIAGIGNLYASEILHRAGIHPQKHCNRLNGEAWNRIHAATLEVLNEAIRYEGSTLSDGTYRNAQNDPGGYQHHHRVYDRAGQLCSTCHDQTIVRIVQSQRSTFYCPACQPKRRRVR
ncbi:MAG: bifunctional DNA-formamidopyrimidine glycosylase/DNA-(apurinic or apyrimidinic site) lyase [Planctomycetes bacterium]|nr:bifunctional DNA-formamidopyrimidine glycosylase/DNA-(apurinic or apyrimidinic site) lyase [Planctomycetota bacterium]